MDVWKNKEKSLKTPWKCSSKVLEKGMSWFVGTMYTLTCPKKEVCSILQLFVGDCLLCRIVRSEADTIRLKEEWAPDVGEELVDELQSRQMWSHQNHQHEEDHQRPIFHPWASPPDDWQGKVGTTIDSKISWEPHINITKKATNTLALLRRNTSSCPRNIRETGPTTSGVRFCSMGYVHQDQSRSCRGSSA